MKMSKTNLVVSLLLALYLTSPSLAQFFSPAANQQLPAVPPPTTNDDLATVVGSPPPPPLAPPVFSTNNNLPFGKPLSNQPNYPQQQQQGLANQPLVGPAQPLLGLNQPFSTMDPSLGSGNQMGFPGNLPFDSWAPAERASILVVSMVCLVAFTAILYCDCV